MSKAFTKENDGDEDELPEEEAPRPRGSRHITPEGFFAIQNEIERLWRVDRPKVTMEVSEAAAQGDRSENAEYIYGKKKLREIDRRIRFLSKRLDSLTVVAPQREQLGRVFFGAWVTIEDEDGIESSYRIVGGDETDLASRKISIESPVAKALLGKGVGDTATVLRPKGPMDVTVVKIWYEGLEA
ncbi:MAG: transcription elongation factor GreB [Polyangiaceae bacterium]